MTTAWTLYAIIGVVLAAYGFYLKYKIGKADANKSS